MFVTTQILTYPDGYSKLGWDAFITAVVETSTGSK